MKYCFLILCLFLFMCSSTIVNYSRHNYLDLFTIDTPVDWINAKDSIGLTIYYPNHYEMLMTSIFTKKNGNYNEFISSALIEAIDTSWKPISDERKINENNSTYKIFQNKAKYGDSILTIYHIVSVLNKADKYLYLKLGINKNSYVKDSLKYINIIKSAKIK